MTRIHLENMDAPSIFFFYQPGEDGSPRQTDELPQATRWWSDEQHVRDECRGVRLGLPHLNRDEAASLDEMLTLNT